LRTWILITLAAAQLAYAAEAPEARILRFPDIHEDLITFSHAGDIYIVDADGGTAHRLTSHDGRELFPKFSPDGKHIAFSGEYTGSRQVFVVPVTGGVPKQLTWYNDVGPMPPRGGFDYQVLDWTRDGKSVLFRGNRLPWGVRMGKYFTVPVDGGLEQALPVPEGGTGMYDPSGTKLVYTPIAREFRTWKRYRGGRAQDVWIYDLEADTSRALTSHTMTDNMPMWVGDEIFFTSDRDFTLNLYRISPDGGTPEPVTRHDVFDVLFPSAGPKRIVYEHGGFLRRYDPANGEDVGLEVHIYGDFRETMPKTINVADFVETGDLSPDGKRVAMAARGDIFSIPASEGQIRNLTDTSGVRERNPAWSPDGRWIAYLSDASGEYELYVCAQDGSGEPRRLTDGIDVWAFAPVWSPDSAHLAFSDKSPRLSIVDVESGEITEIHRNTNTYFNQLDWSHDGQWLAYGKDNPNGFTNLWVYDLGEKKHHQLTTEYLNSYAPSFSPDGKYLYFISSRDMNLTFSSYEFDFLYENSDRIYAAALRDEVPNPFAPENAEVTIKEDEDAPADEEAPKKGKKKDKKKEKPAEPPAIQVDGFHKRVFVLPISSGNFNGLAALEGGVLYTQQGTLNHFSLESEKSEKVLDGIGFWTLSSDGKTVAYSSRGSYFTAPVKPGTKGEKIDLSDLEMRIDPKAEWAQIYRDAARLIRDWFYDENLHGYDLDALVEKYQPLVDSLVSRADLDYVLGELGGELVAGHYYVNSGDQVGVARKENGLLGVELEAHASGYYRIARILPGENWQPDFRSPLRDVGVDAGEGDFILAVDGRTIRTDENFYAALEHKGNQVVTLTVNDKPSTEGARETRVRTITGETNLFYLDWIESRKRMVEEDSDGRVGYIHLPNTSFDGYRELYRNFYAQIEKDALILDARYNGGGFIPFHMIELLQRPVLSYWTRRGIEPMRTPAYTHTGPKAALVNGYSSSGGDAFPHYFRQRGLGKLIGTTTWGGLIGLSGNPGFVDGGSISVPMFRIFDEDGNYIIENVGVSPDIEVEDTPHLVARGEDPTLEAAVKHLLEELEKNPPVEVPIPDPINENRKP